MPMNPTGPPTDTAAPVASDALTNATRCARTTSRPRVLGGVGAEAEQVQRTRQPGERGERHDDERQRRDQRAVAADVEIAHQPAQDPERLGEVREVLHEQDQRREERVHRHAGQQQRVGRQAVMPGGRQEVDDGDGEQRAGEAGQRRDRHAEPLQRRREGDGQHRAERRAGGDAERERRRERIAEQALEDDAGGSEGRADQRAGERSRQPGDEEDLRVRIVGERDRPVERAPQADRRRADERRGDERRAAAARRRSARAGDPAADRLHAGCVPTAGRCGTTSEAGRAVTDHVDVDVVERADRARGVRTSSVGPGREHAAVLHHHQRAAEPRRERQIVRRDDDGQSAIAVERVEQRGDAELVLRDRAPRSARRGAGSSRGAERRPSEICASAPR